MNKYQEVLKKVENAYNYEMYFENSDFNIIKELVDRATPKKPEYEGDSYYKGEIVYDTWICPSCGERYEVDYHDYEYCPKCGQHIDWEQEEEK